MSVIKLLTLFISSFIFLSSSMAAPQKIVCSTDNPKGSLHVVALERFGELLKEYSKGQLETDIYCRNCPLKAAKGEEVNVNEVMAGKNIDVTVVAVGNAARKATVLSFMTLPYMFPDLASAKKLFGSSFITSELNQILMDKYKIMAVGWLIGGFRHMTNSKKEVKTLADIKGLKIRTPMVRVMKATYEAFGAQVLPLAWGKVPGALKSGEIDGQENPYSVIVDMEFWNAKQKYITTNGPFLWVGPILMNKDKYKKLSPELQKAVDKAGAEAAQFEWDWIAKKRDEFVNKLKSNKMVITDPTDKKAWIEKARPLWKDAYKTIGMGTAKEGKRICDKVVELLTK